MAQHKKDLQYFKDNAEEDYASVPISVLRYISELEQANGKWEVERAELISISKTGLPSECVEGWGEVKFCPTRNGEGGKCKWCFNLLQS